jgi:hypothetical protein
MSERKKRLCKYGDCDRPAEVPDRYSRSPRLAVCRECHMKLLAGDLANILRCASKERLKKEATDA